jgi:hypothetical protein
MLVNISQMIICNMPIGSNVRMTSSGTASSEESAHLTKLGVRTEGPSTIEPVHVKGNLTILLRKGITERINIRRDLLNC